MQDRERRGLEFQLERNAVRKFREGHYDRIAQTVTEQDRLFQAADITSSFKALASVDLPDDDAALQQREEFLTELCDLTASALSALHPAQLVTLLWSCGRLGHHPGELLSQLSQQLEPHVHSLGTKQLTLVAWSLAKLSRQSAAEGRLLDAVASAGAQRAADFAPLAARCIDDFDAQSLCNLLYGLAVLQQPLGTELAAALPLAIAHRVYEFTPQGLAVSVWALSGLQAAGECDVTAQLLDLVAERAVALAADFGPLDTCNLLVAFARFGYAEEACISAVCGATAQQQQAFGRLETVGTLWALGKLEAAPPKLLPLLAARAEQLLADMDMREVSNVLTAFSRLDYAPESPQLLPALMERALVGVPDMSSQTLANISTAPARLPALPQTQPLAQAIRAEFCWRHRTGGDLPKPEEVVNLLSGHVRTETADAALCDAAIAGLAVQLPAVRLQHLSTLLHSLGKARYSGQGALFSDVLRLAVQQLAEHSADGPPRQLATVLWGLARVSPGLRAVPLPVAASLAARLPDFNARDIVFAAYACDRLRGVDGALPHAIAAEIEARGFGDFTLGEVAYIARGLTAHRALTPQLQEALRELMRDDPRIQRWQLVHIGRSLKTQAKSP